MHDAAELPVNRLVAAARAGCPESTNTLLAQVRPMVVGYCRRRIGAMAGGWHAADDVAQEVCLAVLRALPRYEDRGVGFRTFVLAVAANKLADQQRATINAPAPTDELPETTDRLPGPEERSMDQEELRIAYLLIRQLPPRMQVALVLRAQGLDATATAARLGTTPGAVRVLQHRAAARVRDLAERDGVLRDLVRVA